MRGNAGILKAHIAVFFFGLSGILAKLIDQSATVVTCARSLLGALFILIFIAFWRKGSWPARKSLPAITISGFLLALHWIAFYTSVKVSTVSIAVITVSTFPIMTALAEPLVIKEEKWSWRLLLAPVVVSIGTFIMIGNAPNPSDVSGMKYGFLAAFIYLIIHIINKVHVVETDGVKLSFIQLALAGAILLPLSINSYDPVLDTDGMDIPYTIILALFSTAIAYSLFIVSMKNISARLAAILCGLEPVYAILLAVPLLNEVVELRTLIGGAVILIAVVWSSLQARAPLRDSDVLDQNV